MKVKRKKLQLFGCSIAGKKESFRLMRGKLNAWYWNDVMVQCTSDILAAATTGKSWSPTVDSVKDCAKCDGWRKTEDLAIPSEECIIDVCRFCRRLRDGKNIFQMVSNATGKARRMGRSLSVQLSIVPDRRSAVIDVHLVWNTLMDPLSVHSPT